MGLRRTIVLRIGPDRDISETIRTFNDCTNYFLGLGFDNKTHAKNRLQTLGYHEARKIWPRLQASLVQGARDCACDMLKREKDKRRPVKKNNSSARFNQRTFSVFFDKKVISMTTVAGRKRIPFVLPDYFRKYETGKVVALRAREHSNVIVIDLIVELPDVPVKEVENPTVIGIDRGVNNIAVTSDGEFFNSRRLRNVRSRYAFVKKRLQSVGTRSAKRKLKRLAGRERRFQADVNHCVSKTIARLNAEVIALEDLHIDRTKKMGKRFNRMLGGWAYAQLESFIDYKCEELGKLVVKVPPEYTSKMCSRCGNIGARKKHSFHCTVCGLRLNADLNGARNIARLGTALTGRLPVNEPIVACHDIKPRNLVEHSYKPRPLGRGI
jgi:IS605 OrfB family transposase